MTFADYQDRLNSINKNITIISNYSHFHNEFGDIDSIYNGNRYDYQLACLVDEKNSIINFFKENTTFKKEVLIKFLLKYLTLNEKKKYQFIKLNLDKLFQMDHRINEIIKRIIFKNEDYYSLFDNYGNFKENLKIFPYLEDLAKRIIDTKLRNPEISNEEALNGELNKAFLAYHLFGSLDNQKNNKKEVTLNLKK